jgi:hypothetical protein
MGDEVFDHHVFERARAILAIDESHIGQGLRQDDDEGRRSSGTDLPVDLLRQPSPRPLASPAGEESVVRACRFALVRIDPDRSLADPGAAPPREGRALRPVLVRLRLLPKGSSHQEDADEDEEDSGPPT